MSTDRIIIHSSIASAFLATLKSTLSSMPTSAPASTVVSSASQSRLQSLVSDALSTGAHVFHGNHDGPDQENSEEDNASVCFAPTVLGGLTENMAIWHDEAFGPLVGLMVAQSEDEAVGIANKTGYGLSAAVFTKDLRKGLALAKRIESG